MTAPSRPSLSLSIEAAFVNALAGSAWAPAETVGLRLGRRGVRVGGLLGLLGEGTRDLIVGAGRAAFGRSTLRLGADVALARGRVTVGLRAEALLALLYLRGAGFQESFDRFDADVGLPAGVRLGVRLGRVRPTLGSTRSAGSGPSRPTRSPAWARPLPTCRASSCCSFRWSRSANDVWAIGNRQNADAAFTFHWDGSAWTASSAGQAQLPASRLAVEPSGEVWVTGDGLLYRRRERNLRR